ncbi:MAG: hypothetical protein Q7S11_03320 [bacterium]|nr:hypothetical protein [bacterium]
MIHFFYGENSARVREKFHEFLDGFFAKNPDAPMFEMNAESWSEEKFGELLASRGLFGGRSVIVLDSLLQDIDAEGTVLEKLKEMKDSPNIFVIIEGKLTKVTAERVAKKTETTQESTVEKIAKKIEFDRFALSDALGRRSKKDAWVLLQKSFDAGGVAEEIHGMLFWQVKSMILAVSSKTAGEAGLNPFVFRKSLSFAKNFTEEELKNLSSRLVSIYHEARRGGDELGMALEKFVLSI